MNALDHTNLAAVLRQRVLDECIASQMAAERGDRIGAADHLDLRDLCERGAEHHEHLAAWIAALVEESPHPALVPALSVTLLPPSHA